ncbi:MAG: hypothetical protein R6X16_08490 [Anaerolineae bacterium]
MMAASQSNASHAEDRSELEQRECALTIVFDKDQIDAAGLKDACSRILPQCLQAFAEIEISEWASGHPHVTVTGPLVHVDKCHGLLGSKLIEKEELRFFRLEDSAGDNIRRALYPIIARVERNLRAFVDQAGTCALGFSAWNSFVTHALGFARPNSPDASRGELPVSMLERTQFDSLVRLITVSVQEWESARSISAADLLYLLEDAESIGEVRDRLRSRMLSRSAWEEMFADLFVGTDSWEQVKRDLQWIVQVRHGVMHHRPIRYAVVQAVREKGRSIYESLVEAAKRLPDVTMTAVAAELRSLQASTPERWAVQYFVTNRVSSGTYGHPVDVSYGVPRWAESLFHDVLQRDTDRNSAQGLGSQQISIWSEPVENMNDIQVDHITGSVSDTAEERQS